MFTLIFTFVSWIYAILTVLANGIQSLVTNASLPKRTSLPDPYFLPTRTSRFYSSTHYLDSPLDNYELYIAEYSLRHGYLDRHLQAQLLLQIEDVAFHQIKIWTLESTLGTSSHMLDNYNFDCSGMDFCDRKAVLDAEMDFITATGPYLRITNKGLFRLYAWKFFNGKYYHICRNLDNGRIQNVITTIRHSPPTSPSSTHFYV